MGITITKKEPADNTDSKWIPDAKSYANVKDVLDTTYKLELEKRNALSFDGVDDYVDCGNDSSLSLANSDFTIEVWAKRATSGDSNYLFGQGTEKSTNKALHLGYRDNNKFTFAFYGNDLDTASTYSDVNTLVHWVGTYNAQTKKRIIYRNGVNVAENTASANFSGNSTTFLGATGWAALHFKGIIYESRVYLRTLSSTEVSDLYNGKPVSSTNLVGHWKLDEGTGTTAGDSSGNNNDGTISGATWNGASYNAYPPHYGNGYRVSKPLSLDSIKKVTNSNIKWTATKPTNTDIKIYTAVSSSNTTEPTFPTDYTEATSNSTIPGISTNQDLTGKYLWIRQKLSTTIDDTPTLSTLEVLIETAKKSLAFFKFF